MPPIRNKSSTVSSVSAEKRQTVGDLRKTLKDKGISTPSSFTRRQLEALLQENVNVEITSSSSTETSDVQTLVATVQTLSETVEEHGRMLQDMMVSKANSPSNEVVSANDELNLIQNQSGINSTGVVHAGMFPHIRSVTSTQRQNIIEGKYINLASLLVSPDSTPEYKQVNIDGTVVFAKPKDLRLQRNLNIQEFIEAFTVYKNIVCETSDRMREFDMYLQDIIDMSVKYKGCAFYEYHKAFANKVAIIKQTKGLIVDWSVRDEKLYSSICTGYQVNICDFCKSPLHISAMCPNIHTPTNNTRTPMQQKSLPEHSSHGNQDTYTKQNVDSYGRQKLFYRGREVCNNFLAGSCRRNDCVRAHVITTDKAIATNRTGKNATQTTPGKGVSRTNINNVPQ